MQPTDVDLVRFFSKIIYDDSDCWLWNAFINPDGYGRYNWDGFQQNAHRVSYEWWNGAIPEGLVIDHLCRIRRCVNPSHLEAVTQKENFYRGESPIAQQTQRNHCPQGHRYDEENTYLWKNIRYCRRCNNKYSLAWYHKKKESSSQ